MSNIIAIVNHKGGVGKTSTTMNLGKALSMKGKKTLVIDMDPQTNLSQGLGFEDQAGNTYEVLCENVEPNIIQVSENYYLLPSSLELAKADNKLQTQLAGHTKLKKKVAAIAKEYDYVLIDCPPSLGILTINAMTFATDMLIVADADYFSTKGLQTILEMHQEVIEDLNPNLHFMGVVFTRLNKTNLKRGFAEGIREQYGDKVFNTVIRENIKIAEAIAHQKDIFTYDPNATGAEDYRNLANEILND